MVIGLRLPLMAIVVLSSAFLTPNGAAQTTPQMEKDVAALLDRIYSKPPRDVPLRVGVLPSDAVQGAKISKDPSFRFCNRIWQDQSGSYDRPFAVMFMGNRKATAKGYAGMFALDKHVVDTQESFARLELAAAYGKGDRGAFDAANEAVLLIDHEQETGVGHRFWSLYLKRLKDGRCDNEKRSECKRFEAEAELFEFDLHTYSTNFLRKADIGKVHIESRCVGQKYLYHREPFLEPSGFFERLLNRLLNH